MADIGRDEPDLVDLGVEGKGTPAADPNLVELRDEAEDEDALPDRAVVMEDGTIELMLLHPVTLRFKKGETTREESFDTLRFYPLTGADMRVIQSQAKDSLLPTAIARSTRIHEGKINAVYDRLDARDATAAQRCVLHFLGSGQ